jgi:hypothetical protein
MMRMAAISGLIDNTTSFKLCRHGESTLTTKVKVNNNVIAM